MTERTDEQSAVLADELRKVTSQLEALLKNDGAARLGHYPGVRAGEPLDRGWWSSRYRSGAGAPFAGCLRSGDSAVS